MSNYPRVYPLEHLLDKSHGCSDPIELYLVDRQYGHPLQLLVGCNHRFDAQCPECAELWRHKNFSKFQYGISQMVNPRMMTLTMYYDKSTGICHHIKRIWQCRNLLFKELQRDKYLEARDIKTHRRVRGDLYDTFKFKSWVAILELPNHIHLVYDGDYIPQELISALWLKITGDSFIVDIRKVRTNGPDRRLSRYLSKYLSSLSNIPSHLVQNLTGFHLFQSHGLKQSPKKPLIVNYRGSRFGTYGWSKVDRDDYPEYVHKYHDQKPIIRLLRRKWQPKSVPDRGQCPLSVLKAIDKWHRDRGLRFRPSNQTTLDV